MTKIIISSVFVYSLGLGALASSVGPIEKNSDGSLLAMSQTAASKYCESKGSRLPTLRELAELTVSMGAKPIRETSYPATDVWTAPVYAEIEKNYKDGYYAVLQSSGHYYVAFYINPTGYRTPSFDEQAGFWSSSPGSLLLGKEGVVSGPGYEEVLAGIRCVR